MCVYVGYDGIARKAGIGRKIQAYDTYCDTFDNEDSGAL
jgi:hypothetical protein